MGKGEERNGNEIWKMEKTLEVVSDNQHDTAYMASNTRKHSKRSEESTQCRTLYCKACSYLLDVTR